MKKRDDFMGLKTKEDGITIKITTHQEKYSDWIWGSNYLPQSEMIFFSLILFGAAFI